jgi:uncharacterized membrane protein YdjX (TVP38/TMEM64 family)
MSRKIERAVDVIAWGLVAMGAIELLRRVPSAEIADWLLGAGPAGPVAFGAAFIVGTMLLVPCGAMMLAAGATFGPWLGTITISLASTVAATLAFFVARGLARRRLSFVMSRNPGLASMDRFVAVAGWRFIALLRLSLVVPFGLSNYALGLSSVRFLPYLFTSWIAMLPACALYGWLGHLGARGLDAALGSEGWVLGAIAVGLGSSIALTVYARRIVGKPPQLVLRTRENDAL